MTKPASNLEERLLGADFVRAAACLIVLFHHLAQRMNWRADFGIIDGMTVFSKIGTFGVAMFFVLSGYLLARPFWSALDAGKPMPSLRTYAIRRAARIFPAFWLALGVTFVLSIVVFEARLDGQLVLRLLTGVFGVADWHWVTLFPVEVNGPLWSISFEITSYVLLPLGLISIFALRSRLPSWASRLAWIGIIALTLVAHWLFVTYYYVDEIDRTWNAGLIGGAKTWMPRYNPFGFFAMFAIGSLAAGLQLWAGRHKSWLFDALAIGAIVLAVWQFQLQLGNPEDSGYGWLGVPYAFPWFVLTVGLLLVATPSSVLVGRLLDNPVTVFIARISFGIYIWHYVVLELVRVYWDPQLVYGTENNLTQFSVSSLIVIGGTLIAALASFYLVERPAIRWARGLEKRRTPEPISATAPA